MSLESCLERRDIWQGYKNTPATGPTIASGFDILDAHLPGGGWPLGALTEILLEDIVHSPLWLVLPALVTLAPRRRWQAWVTPPGIPYTPALHGAGLDVSKVLLVKAKNRAEALWATEQSLRSSECSAVLCWPGQLKRATLRRLQLAAEHGQALGLCFRGLNAIDQPSTAALRLHCQLTVDGANVDILKCRGGALREGLRVRRHLLPAIPPGTG